MSSRKKVITTIPAVRLFSNQFVCSQLAPRNRAQDQLLERHRLVRVLVVLTVTHPVQIPNRLHPKNKNPLGEVVLGQITIKMQRL